ncbi:MAG: hypothetical protein PHC51_12345 [bacterium]|nr:hypothetical protein [bacterium]
MTAIGEILLSAFTFLLLWHFLGQGVFKHFFQMLEDREQRTEGARKKAHGVEDEVISLKREIEDALRSARVEGVKRRDELVERAKSEAQALVDAATERAAMLVEEERSNVRTVLTAELSRVAEEAEIVAQVIVDKAMSPSSSISIH